MQEINKILHRNNDAPQPEAVLNVILFVYYFMRLLTLDVVHQVGTSRFVVTFTSRSTSQLVSFYSIM